MKLFSKIKAGNGLENSRNILKEKLDDHSRKVQAAWAGWMQKITAGMGYKAWIVAMLCLIFGIGGYSSYLIVQVFTTKPEAVIHVTKIRKPAYSGHTGEPEVVARVTDAEYSRISKFRRYMDSLAADPTGNAAYKRIVTQRPGLMDSIRQVEIYYQQLKNK